MEQRTLAEVVKAFTQFRIKELNLDSSVFKKRWEYFPGLHSFLQWQESYMFSEQMINNFLEYQKSKRKTKSALRNLEEHCRYLVDFSKGKEIVFQRLRKYQLRTKESEKIFSEILESQLPHKLHRSEIALIRHFLFSLEKSNTPFQNISNQTFLDFIKETAVTNKGSQRYVVLTLRILGRFAKEKYDCNFTIDFSYWKAKEAPKRVIEPFTSDEIKLIYQEIIKNQENGVRDSAIVLLAATTGLRYCDVSSLKLSDINWEKKKIYILQNKTKVPVEIPLINKVLNVLADYILNHRPKTDNPYVFLREKEPHIQITGNRFNFLLNDYCKKAGVVKKEGRAFHSLRRSFATELSLEDVPVTTISQLLGHTNIINDKVYLTYNVSKTLECAFDFSEIPLKSPVYAEVLL